LRKSLYEEELMNKPVTTRKLEGRQGTLYLALELARREWKLGFATGVGQRARERTIRGRDLEGLRQEVEAAKRRLGLRSDARVQSCYEAGRDGFWLHRALVAMGIENVVVDSASIEVNRRARRAKTDRLDVNGLIRLLVRWAHGERGAWKVVRVPSVKAEDARHLHRELTQWKRDRGRATNRIKGLLATQGVEMRLGRGFVEALGTVEVWDGSGLGPGLRSRLEREWARVEWIGERIEELEAERREALRSSEDAAVEKVRQLMALRGIGVNTAWLYVMEFFGWRGFRNRREVGALAGLTPTPHRSGDSAKERGISKSGNVHVRAIAIEIAWGWLRHQPESALSQWYQEQWGGGSKRHRKIGIVALARRLLVELWRYLETGALPEGAVTVR
jgi:transposase